MSEPAEHVTRTEVIGYEPAEALANLLGTDLPEHGLPPLWHLVYLLDRPSQSELGPDGHPTLGVPAPPGPGRRRMYAGGTLTTHRQLLYGKSTTRRTRVAATQEKQGRTGPLTFVTVRNEYTQDGAIALVHEHDIVYLGADFINPLPSVAKASPLPTRECHLELTVDEALLFRFSALTYNAHRIHYDHNWVRKEGYADLVVHGPLQTLMMGELMRRAGIELVGRRFDYRMVSPMIGPQTFRVAANEAGIDEGVEVFNAHGTITAVGASVPTP